MCALALSSCYKYNSLEAREQNQDAIPGNSTTSSGGVALVDFGEFNGRASPEFFRTAIYAQALNKLHSLPDEIAERVSRNCARLPNLPALRFVTRAKVYSDTYGQVRMELSFRESATSAEVHRVELPVYCPVPPEVHRALAACSYAPPAIVFESNLPPRQSVGRVSVSEPSSDLGLISESAADIFSSIDALNDEEGASQGASTEFDSPSVRVPRSFRVEMTERLLRVTAGTPEYHSRTTALAVHQSQREVDGRKYVFVPRFYDGMDPQLSQAILFAKEGTALSSLSVDRAARLLAMELPQVMNESTLNQLESNLDDKTNPINVVRLKLATRLGQIIQNQPFQGAYSAVDSSQTPVNFFALSGTPPRLTAPLLKVGDHQYAVCTLSSRGAMRVLLEGFYFAQDIFRSYFELYHPLEVVPSGFHFRLFRPFWSTFDDDVSPEFLSARIEQLYRTYLFGAAEHGLGGSF